MMDKLFHRFLSPPEGGDDVSISNMTPPPLPSRIRKVSVAMFGSFRPEEASMPERVEDASNCGLINEPLAQKKQRAPTGRDGQVPHCLTRWTADIRWVLKTLHKQSGRPNMRNRLRSPPPALRFMEFILAQVLQALCLWMGCLMKSRRVACGTMNAAFYRAPKVFWDWSITLTVTRVFVRNRAPGLGYLRLY